MTVPTDRRIRSSPEAHTINYTLTTICEPPYKYQVVFPSSGPSWFPEEAQLLFSNYNSCFCVVKRRFYLVLQQLIFRLVIQKSVTLCAGYLLCQHDTG